MKRLTQNKEKWREAAFKQNPITVTEYILFQIELYFCLKLIRSKVVLLMLFVLLSKKLVNLWIVLIFLYIEELRRISIIFRIDSKTVEILTSFKDLKKYFTIYNFYIVIQFMKNIYYSNKTD